MWDYEKFFVIMLWLTAIVSTILTVSSAYWMYYFYYTPRGEFDRACLQFKGLVPRFRWFALVICVTTWIAIFCLK